MMAIFLLFLPLFLATPPLILGTWVVLIFRFGVLGPPFKQTKRLVDLQKEHAVKNKTWMILTIGVFSVFIILCLCLNLLLGQQVKDLETSISGERDYSIVISFLYSPVGLVLILEAWLMLLSYFGLYSLLHRLEVPVDRSYGIRGFAVAVIQLMGVLTGLIGFGWWSYLGITDQGRFGTIYRFSVGVLSPSTVLLTAGLVIMLFITLSKILPMEENTKQHAQVAERMTIMLLSTLILLGLIGGILSILFHYDHSQWNNL